MASYNDFQEDRRYYKEKYEWRDDELSALYDIMRERDILKD